MIYPFPEDFSDLIDPEEDIEIPENECCICLSEDVQQVVEIQGFRYPFCANDEHRAELLQRGQKLGWPALRYKGITGTYALDSDVQMWALNALQGTNERVVELLDALDEYEQKEAA